MQNGSVLDQVNILFEDEKTWNRWLIWLGDYDVKGLLVLISKKFN